MEKIIMQEHYVEKKTYSVPEMAHILGISTRSAYNLCSYTSDFRVLRLGRTVRIHKESFDKWFSSCS